MNFKQAKRLLDGFVGVRWDREVVHDHLEDNPNPLHIAKPFEYWQSIISLASAGSGDLNASKVQAVQDGIKIGRLIWLKKMRETGASFPGANPNPDI